MIDLIDHLERQLESSRRLLGSCSPRATRSARQDVEAVLARLADVQAEMVNRARLERERDALLRAGRAPRSACAATSSTLEDLLVAAARQTRRSARASCRPSCGPARRGRPGARPEPVLIRQELAFLDHLMRVLSGAPQGGYSPTGWTRAPQPANLVDARA